MILTEQTPAIMVARNAIADRTVPVATAAKSKTERPFVESPSKPLNDDNRDAFLAMLEDDSEPNAALSSGADSFKSLGI